MSQQTNTRASAHLQQLQSAQTSQSNNAANANSGIGHQTAVNAVSDKLRAQTPTSGTVDLGRNSDNPRTPNKSTTSPMSIESAVGTEQLVKKRSATLSDADSIINYKKRNLDHLEARKKVLKEK